MYAIGSNPTAARLAGIRTKRTIRVLFLLSGLACALAGLILTSMLGSASPIAATGLELSVVTAIILGGHDALGRRGDGIRNVDRSAHRRVPQQRPDHPGVDPFWQNVAQGGLLIGAVSFDRLRERLSGDTET